MDTKELIDAAMSFWLVKDAAGWVVDKTFDASIRGLGNINHSRTRFLNHDPKICNQYYHQEGSLGGYLPYKEIFDFSGAIKKREFPQISISTTKEEFFTQGNDINWAVARAQAYYAYRDEGHAKRDSQIVRVNGINVDGECVSMSIQPTRYFCQAESNLVLDFDAYISFEKKKNERTKTTLRQLLYNENPGRFPLLSDRRLANTLGVAICLLSRDGESTLLRMVNRTGTVGVFPSGVHPAMSCAINWKSTVESDDLMGFIMSDIEQEMLQEAGLKRGQYETPVPLSLCREFLRGGKPQLFAISHTEYSQKELNELRDDQVGLNKKYRADKIEMKCSGLFRSNNPSVKATGKSDLKFTHEGAACHFLVDRLLGELI